MIRDVVPKVKFNSFSSGELYECLVAIGISAASCEDLTAQVY
ncbi:hypothetical protein FM104_04835 [Microbacterium esteraromaticum]|uniref:Uncharacterized protein n=1 Tax=Microbacterium esteraromaticum TaxID=57043 RepID=A0A1R4J0Y2_9MICO|nr:hypothetical protein FM104_04835 [Microbacterium esteraromaticum]